MLMAFGACGGQEMIYCFNGRVMNTIRVAGRAGRCCIEFLQTHMQHVVNKGSGSGRR